MEKNTLIVVDMQNDFIDGVLGSIEAEAIVDRVCEKIRTWDGDIFYTMDTHFIDDYMFTTEGKDLPIPHCIHNSDGAQLNTKVHQAILERCGSESNMLMLRYNKDCFGSSGLAHDIRVLTRNVELIGLCTDVCVISNAIMIRNQDSEMVVTVDASCCAGVTPERHRIALEAMKCCGIHVINEACVSTIM